MLRKQIAKRDAHPQASRGEIRIPDAATLSVTSEMPEHPIDCICDDQRGPGSTRWIADETGDQTLVLAFDIPRNLHKVSLEVEETNGSRTQELALSVSLDWGQTYREVLRQEYNFSPPGTTFEHEEWRVPVEGVTNLWFWIRPDKGGKPCRASITSLALE
ncbi:MAG: discoidin domain-containing protein [Nitrospiraceae bacterium]